MSGEKGLHTILASTWKRERLLRSARYLFTNIKGVL